MARKKVVSQPNSMRQSWVDFDSKISLRRQCHLLGISRNNIYYQKAEESGFNLELMSLIDRKFLDHPEFGSPRMTDWINSLGYDINEKRIARLMRHMGIQAITPGPHTSKPANGHKIYPYLLRGLKIEKVNQVWSTDFTYVPMRSGFMYLAAVIDWYSRFVLSWELSNSMENTFCVKALISSLSNHGSPEIFNTDQGSQYTSKEFTDVLKKKDILISMDGRGRALDNVFVERLWWTVKYENIYPKSYEDGDELYFGLQKFFEYYNCERNHSSLQKRTPSEVYFEGA